MKKDAEGNPVTQSIEGDYYCYDVGVREGLSSLQLFRNFQTLQKAGQEMKQEAAILPDSEPILAQIQALLDQRPDLKLRVEGHTDNAGSRAANQKLSEQRAAAVVSWLVAHGVEKSRLAAQGFADTKPVADNSSEEGRAQNRRVELVKM